MVDERPWADVLDDYERDPLTVLIEAQDGIIARSQALRLLSEKAMRHRISTGRWLRVHRGVFYTYGGPLGPSQRRWIAVLAGSTEDGSLLSLGGVSALQVLG